MRQFVSAVNPDKSGLIQVTGKDYRYFKQVLRLVPGDMVCVRIPDGSLVNMTVAKTDEKGRCVTLQMCDCLKDGAEKEGGAQSEYSSGVKFYLFQFVAKGPKMDLIVRQAAECGVLKIVPVLAQFTQTGGAEKNFRNSRYERIVREARQQSGSPVPTEIAESVELKDACALWRKIIEGEEEQSFACVLYERSEKTKNLFSALGDYKDIKNCAVFCGAEGGISPEEIDFLSSNGVIPLHFETNILRCETAALYGVACVQNAVTEKKRWQKTN